MSKSKVVLLVIILCIVFVAVYTFLHFRHHSLQETQKFIVVNPWRQNIDIKKEYVAQIKAIQHIELRSLERGYLQETYIDEGQFVKKGQKLFQIMPTLLEAEFKKVEAEYDKTKIEYDNTHLLYKQNIVSANELAITKARLKKAQAEMGLAKAHVELATIKAPFDGIVDRFHVRLGSLIEEGDLLTTMADNSKMWVYFNVSEVDYLNYMSENKNHIQMPVQLRLANDTIFPETGVIEVIEADFNNEVGNVAFRATFNNPEKVLRHGETGNVLLATKYPNALIIPQKATFDILNKKFVYVVDSDGILHDREIEILAELPHIFIISSGVTESDTILIDGIGKVHAGEKIETEHQNVDEVKKSLELIAS